LWSVFTSEQVFVTDADVSTVSTLQLNHQHLMQSDTDDGELTMNSSDALDHHHHYQQQHSLEADRNHVQLPVNSSDALDHHHQPQQHRQRVAVDRPLTVIITSSIPSVVTSQHHNVIYHRQDSLVVVASAGRNVTAVKCMSHIISCFISW